MADVRHIRRRRPDDDLEAVDSPASALRRAAKGDEAAFGEFYDMTQRRIFGVVLRVVRDRSLAEEITQEVYVEIWRLAPRFDQQRGSAVSWATTVAHRRAVDRVRSEQSRRDREDRQHVTPVVVPDPVGDVVTDQLDNTRVHSALATLSESQREAVSLAYFSGYTYREVAAVLELPEGTVKTRIRDGLIRLRDHFGVTP
ncbi:MAG: sigma-70 family RNA polymerase sigma factor [Actinobacteria bacterium]|nr:sigma-70 family RNA polymerase sigma factor [Actinomycetota bacterium]